MSRIKTQTLLLAMILTAFTALGQGTNNVRGLYVNGTSTWLGDSIQENQILKYAQLRSFNCLTLYDLNIGWTMPAKNKLAAFIKKAKVSYGVQQVAAAGESYGFFANVIVPYNNSRTLASERFDVLNYEFEFWLMSSINAFYSAAYLIPNGFTPDTAGAFAFAIREFTAIDLLCSNNGLISEIYLGWPTRGQMQKIAAIADRILLHAYRPTDFDVYSYSRLRLQDIASIKTPVNVMPIFSSEPMFMQPWLVNNPLTRAYQTYRNDYLADTGAVKQYVKLAGYQWFVYNYMPNPYIQAAITAHGPTTFCNGGSVTLTANAGNSYLWMPGGATTSSISATTSGSYTVRVTDAQGNVHVSAPINVIVTSTGQVPVITANGSIKVCTGGNVTLTSSPADSYIWSNGATTQSITVYTPGNYTVQTTSAGCTATSEAISFQVVAPPVQPVITSGGPINICPGNSVTLTSSPSDGYLWSNGATTRSIVVNAAGYYNVRSYNAPYCSTASAPVNVQMLAAPAVPVITASGSTTLTPQNPSVILTSGLASAYNWSTTQTTRSIFVNSQGSYRVTVSGPNGCKSTSAAISVIANGCTPPPVPVITASGTTDLLPGQTVTLTSNLSGGYLWSNGATTQSITVGTAGIYSVRNYNNGNCYSTSLPLSVRVLPARIRSDEQTSIVDSDIYIYPNPAQSFLETSLTSTTESKGVFSITDMRGTVVFSKPIEIEIGENKLTFDIAHLAPGIYVTRLFTNDKTSVAQIVVER